MFTTDPRKWMKAAYWWVGFVIGAIIAAIVSRLFLTAGDVLFILGVFIIVCVFIAGVLIGEHTFKIVSEKQTEDE